MTECRRIAVYCGASFGNDGVYAQEASKLGQLLVEYDITLVYGGGRVGLMGTIADSVMANGGKVIGVIPEFLATKEIAHQHLTELHIVQSMHERKAMMADLSDAYIAMPGGFGTLEELFEVLTWAQLGLHQKPIGLLNTKGYYQGLLDFFEHLVNTQFISDDLRNAVLYDNSPEKLLVQLMSHEPRYIDKWSDESKDRI